MFYKQVVGYTIQNLKFTTQIIRNQRRTFLNVNFSRTLTNQVNNRRNYCSSLTHTYTDTENNFIYQVVSNKLVQNSPILENEVTDEISLTNHLNRDWRQSNASEIVRGFQTVQKYCSRENINFSDPRFDGLVDGLMDHCEKLTDKELLDLLTCIAEYPPCKAYTSHNYHDLWSCLDDICCWKLPHWDINTMFVYGDIWYKLKLGKLCDYVFELLDRLVKKADHMSKDQLVRIFFFFNVCRKRPVDFQYEYAIQQKMYELNVDEMAVVALGYFKSKSKIKVASLMEAMVKEVQANAMGVHEISLTAIMKVLRLSVPIKLVPQITKMLDSLYPEMDRLSDLACLHLALLSTGLYTFHPNILRKCAQKLVENIHNTRLKDIERILHVVTMFTFDPQTKPDIYEACFEELHKDSRIAEFNKYPRCLGAALNYLGLKGIYSYVLMDRLLDKEFISMHFGCVAKMLPRQVFSLDASIDVECPDYQGNRLPPNLKYKAAKWLSDWPPSRDQYNKISKKQELFLDTVDVVTKLVGNEDFVDVRHVLPHFPMADIIVCKNLKTGQYIKPFGFERYILGDVMKPFNDGSFEWYAVVVMTWANTIRETTAPLGYTALKKRQLEKIGYKSVMIFSEQYLDLTTQGKEEYILERLRSL